MSNSNCRFEVTFVITSHNQAGKIDRCIKSLPWSSPHPWEAIVVDDASTDETISVVRRAIPSQCEERHALSIIQLEKNSGGPSVPRNEGISAAKGNYIFFIDGDDELDSRHFDKIMDLAAKSNFDLIRLPMQVIVDAGTPRVVDRVSISESDTITEILTKCVSLQSMGVMAFIRRSLVQENDIKFDPKQSMGEDLIFMSEVCKHIHTMTFVDAPLYKYLKSSVEGSSATTSYSSEAFSQAITAWDKVQKNYLRANVDFLHCHGAGSISYALQQLQKYYVKPSKEMFDLFAKFCKQWKQSIRLEKFGDPFRVLVQAALDRDYDAFKEGCKLRLLIAGSDLKFIKSAIPVLQDTFQVKVDEWKAEKVFDEKTTLEHLQWAQVVWSEWMTYAAEWFSKNIRPSQKLIVRCHFYELTRDSGFKMDASRISAVVAIALHTYEDLIDKFELPRNKVHLIPNYYSVDEYQVRGENWNPYALALVGSVPRRKGLHRALEILNKLRSIDPRYTLTIFGKPPTDFGWVYGVEAERQYYQACDDYISEHNLADAITYPGWADIRSELNKFACVLSTSDFEGSHVAPGEAFCAEIPMASLNWRGAKYVYPEEFIFEDVDDIVQSIVEVSKKGPRSAELAAGKQFFREHQDLPVFAEDVKKLIQNCKAVYEL